MNLPFNYNDDEVISALQKSIRRGKEEDALFWATEMDLDKHADQLWERLRIIASEDVGIASLTAHVEVESLYRTWMSFGPGDARRLFLVHAVLLLVRAPKSRIVDHATIVNYSVPRQQLKIPDYAKDKHTRSGAAMGRGFVHFLEEGAHLENASGIDPYEERAKRYLIETEKIKKESGQKQ